MNVEVLKHGATRQDLSVMGSYRTRWMSPRYTPWNSASKVLLESPRL